MNASTPLLEARSISKAFGAVQALEDVSIDLRAGEVLALMGENGAGKSTLMNVIAGIHTADRGEILIDGTPQVFHGALDSLAAGIGMIHQELMSLPDMTVAENIYAGREPVNRYTRLVSQSRMRAGAAEALARVDLKVEPTRRMGSLSAADRQLVEIAKALTLDPKVLILDEPTSSLSEREAEHLFEQIDTLRAEGVGMIYISHRMDEVYRLADRIAVLRDGQLVGTYPADELPQPELIRLMVGRELSTVFVRDHVEPGEELLRISGLSGHGVGGAEMVVRRGEVVGIAGLVGAGRSEVAEMIFGLRSRSGGSIQVNGRTVDIRAPWTAIANRLALVPEDRKLVGLNLKGSVRENIALASLRRLMWGPFVDKRRETAESERLREQLRIKTSSVSAPMTSLSGGNQQKVVLARWLLRGFDTVLLDEPTRGIDVGAKVEIYRMINDLAKGGAGVLMISSELPEIIGLCDRTYVMYEGRVMGELTRDEMTQHSIMALASGIQEGLED